METISERKELLIKQICNLIKDNSNIKMIIFLSNIPTKIKNDKNYILYYIQIKDNSSSLQINYTKKDRHSPKIKYILIERLHTIFEPLNILDLLLIKTVFKNRRFTKKPYLGSEIII